VGGQGGDLRRRVVRKVEHLRVFRLADHFAVLDGAAVIDGNIINQLPQLFGTGARIGRLRLRASGQQHAGGHERIADQPFLDRTEHDSHSHLSLTRRL
jgi:hypothetical protein